MTALLEFDALKRRPERVKLSDNVLAVCTAEGHVGNRVLPIAEIGLRLDGKTVRNQAQCTKCRNANTTGATRPKEKQKDDTQRKRKNGARSH